MPLPLDREIIVGRAGEVDLLILDDKVSRKHAKISTFGETIVIEDTGSRNGVFVNGEQVHKAKLAEGDEVQIGSSTMKLTVLRNGATPDATVARPAKPKPAQGLGSSMTGSIAEVPLPDLLQLLVSSRKTGALTLRNGHGTGQIHLRDGRVFSASIDGDVRYCRRAKRSSACWAGRAGRSI